MDFEFKNHKSLIFICLIIFPIIFFVILYTQITYAQSSIEVRRAQLENNLEIIEEQIEKTKLSIKARDISIAKLNQDINKKEKAIDTLNKKLEKEKESLGQLIRKTNKIDNVSLAEIMLGNQNLSDFFEDIDTFNSIKTALNKSFKEIEGTKISTESQKRSFQDKQSEEMELRDIQRLQKNKIEKQEKEKQIIIEATKGIEAEYQKLIKAKEKNAAQIRSELFALRGPAAIPFEQALELANIASKKTGVRSAFILGVRAEESNLGENIGTGNWKEDLYQCYKSIGYITSAEKQKAAFLKITSDLGLNPDILPVSKKPWYGCGGAMGPAQFMPTTWTLYTDRIAKAVGHNPPNPWNPSDAFMAAAILLMDNGADKGTQYAERLAALRYLAGWKNAEKPSYSFYGDDVMELAAKYQKLIDILQGD